MPVRVMHKEPPPISIHATAGRRFHYGSVTSSPNRLASVAAAYCTAPLGHQPSGTPGLASAAGSRHATFESFVMTLCRRPMPPFFAFLHHVAAFALVAALVLEFVLVKDELTLASARRLRATDAVFGLSAGLVLAVGLLRVFYFEKGADYYLHSVPFLAKISLFFLIAILSIYPTVVFLSWKRPLAQGRLPDVAPAKLQRIRALLHIELVAVVLLILCAALMARGVGYFG